MRSVTYMKSISRTVTYYIRRSFVKSVLMEGDIWKHLMVVMISSKRLVLFNEIFAPAFTEKSIWEVYFKYTSFILQILEVQQKYALKELPKKKYKWNIKTEKNKKTLCLYFSNTLYIFVDFFWNEIYFKYTSEFEKK